MSRPLSPGMLVHAPSAALLLALCVTPFASGCGERAARTDSTADTVERAARTDPTADTAKGVVSLRRLDDARREQARRLERACMAEGRALTALLDRAEYAILPDSTEDTGLGLLVHRQYHRGDRFNRGSWLLTPHAAVDTIAVRSGPATDAPPVALFNLRGDSIFGDCQFVVPIAAARATARADSLYSAAISPWESSDPAALIVDSVGADSQWVRVVYAQNAERAYSVGGCASRIGVPGS